MLPVLPALSAELPDLQVMAKVGGPGCGQKPLYHLSIPVLPCKLCKPVLLKGVSKDSLWTQTRRGLHWRGDAALRLQAEIRHLHAAGGHPHD